MTVRSILLSLKSGGGSLNASLPASINLYGYNPSGTGIAQIKVRADGIIEYTEVSGSTTTGTWRTGGGTGADYEVRATTVSGTLTTGTTGAWLSLSTNQTFNVEKGGLRYGIKTWTGVLEIRKAAGPPNPVYATSDPVALTAETEGSGA